MPQFKETSRYYENFLNQLGGYLGQNEVNTGRSPTSNMLYGTTKGVTSSLLDYDIARRRQQQQMQLQWQQQHDARKKSGAGVAGGIAKGVLGAGMMMTGVGAPAGAGLMASGLGSILGGSGGGSGIAGINQNPGLMGMFKGAPMGGFGDWQQSGLYPEAGISFADGGVIEEPVVGKGVNSGMNYLLGEEGPEKVTPMGEGEKEDDGNIVDSIWKMFSSNESPFKVDNQSPAQKMMSGKGEGKEKSHDGAKSIKAMSKGVGGVIKMLSAHYSGDTGMAKTGMKELVGAISDAALG